MYSELRAAVDEQAFPVIQASLVGGEKTIAAPISSGRGDTFQCLHAHVKSRRSLRATLDYRCRTTPERKGQLDADPAVARAKTKCSQRIDGTLGAA